MAVRVYLLSVAAVMAVLTGCVSSAMSLRSPVAALEQSNVYVPLKYPYGEWHPKGLTFEDAWFDAADGTHLHGWFCPHEKPQAVALFLHGNAGNLTHVAGSLQVLHDRHRLAVMSLDYRGYGRSEGIPNEAGVMQDARAARAWLAKRTGVAEKDIVLLGQSLGGGVAVDLAAKDDCRGLVLASTFTSMTDAAAHHVPYVPTRLLMSNRYDSIRKIKDYRGPLLMVHGDRDRVVPYSQGKKLFEAANEPKRFITATGGDHNDPLPEEYRVALEKFLRELPAVADAQTSTQLP